MAFDAGAIIGHVDLKTGDFIINSEKITKSNNNMTKSMLSAQIQFAIFEKALRGITNFMKDSVNRFIEQEKVEAQLNQTLKSTQYAAGLTAEEIKNMASGFQAVTTYGDEAVIGAQNLLLTFTKIGKDIFPDATEIILDMSTALGQDLKSSAIQVGKALQDPILGATALRRVGVNLSQEQAELIKKFVQTGKTAEAQALILKELQTEFGGSARAARNTLGGSLKALENNIGDAKEAIGSALVPVLTDLVGAIMPVVNWIKGLDKSTIQMALGFAGALAATIALVKGFQKLQSVFSAGITPLQGILLALSAVAAVVIAVNQAVAESKVIHQKLAEQYIKEYEAIDGQVKRYEELKNKTSLSRNEKNELIRVEQELNKQLGEGATYLDEQSGKWRANATAVSQYKKERMELAIRELKAQEIVAQNELKWAKDRQKIWEQAKKELRTTGTLSIKTSLEMTTHQLALRNAADAELFVLQELGTATDKLSGTQEQLNALTEKGVAGWTDYNKMQKDITDGIKTKNNLSEEEISLMEKMKKTRADLSAEFLSDIEKEKYELKKKIEDLEEQYGKQIWITEYYNKKIEEINKEYAKKNKEINEEIKESGEEAAEDGKDAWKEAVAGIKQEIESIVNVVSLVTNAISATWDQAITNEEIALDNEYNKRKEQIEKTITDENEKQAQLAALDEEYEAKKAELQKKAWIASQAGAVTQAIMNTAQAFTAALAVVPPWLGIALAATIAALGAAQVALILAQPMPEYAEGGPARGFGIVGEKGPEVVDFGNGARVYSNEESQKFFSGNNEMNINFYGPVNSDVDIMRVLSLTGRKYKSTLRGAA